jgi:hypothetical protein
MVAGRRADHPSTAWAGLGDQNPVLAPERGGAPVPVGAGRERAGLVRVGRAQGGRGSVAALRSEADGPARPGERPASADLAAHRAAPQGVRGPRAGHPERVLRRAAQWNVAFPSETDGRARPRKRPVSAGLAAHQAVPRDAQGPRAGLQGALRDGASVGPASAGPASPGAAFVDAAPRRAACRPAVRGAACPVAGPLDGLPGAGRRQGAPAHRALAAARRPDARPRDAHPRGAAGPVARLDRRRLVRPGRA